MQSQKWVRVLLVMFLSLTGYTVLVLYLDLDHWLSRAFTPLTTLIGLAVALVHATQRWNGRAGWTLFVLSFFISLTLESVGVATGWVYGPYHYTDQLGAKFLGLVPYIVPVAWYMMMYPSLVMAERVLPDSTGRFYDLKVAALGGMILTAWDLVMDPMMVRGEHWVWEQGGPYFNIPLQNYLGWWLTAFCVFLVFRLALRRMKSPAPHTQDDYLAVILYSATGLSHILICLEPDGIQQLGGAALAGLFAMGPWMLIGWWTTRPARPHSDTG